MQRWSSGTSLQVQGLRLCASTTRGTASVPGWGTKIPHATRCRQKKSGAERRKKLQGKEVESSLLTQRTDLWLPKGRGQEGRMNGEFQASRCQPLYTEWRSSKMLLYSTGNWIQYPVIKHNGKEYICVCVCILHV